MTVSTVGITKKRVRVIEQKTNHSIEYENDVYVVDTSDPTLVLQTGSSSGVDLTGSNTLSSQANSTTTIASGANSTATIGSGNLSTVNLGTGTNTSTKIGTNASGNSTVIRSRDITLGTTSGNHNIYIGESSTSNTSDAIHIGTSTHSNITIGNITSENNNLYVNSRNITLGSRSGSTHSSTIVQGNTVTSQCTSSYIVNSDGYVAINTPLVTIGSDNIDITSTSATIRNESDGSEVTKIALSKTISGGGTQTHRGSTTISSSSRTSGIEYPAARLIVAADQGGKNISLNSSNGILLRASDLQLTNPLTNTSGYYINLTEPQSEYKYVNASNDTVARVAVSSSGVTIGNYSGGLDTNFIKADTVNGTLEIDFAGAILTQNSAGITVSGTDGSTLAGFSNGSYSNKFFSITGFHAVTGGYTPFTGVHIFDVQPDSNISIGDAVIAVNRTAMLTTTPNDKRCIGIVCEILENNKVSVASVGDNECAELKGFKVCSENGPISAGDLLTTSSTAGYLMRQSDDIMRSSTVGKSAVDVVFDDNNQAINVYGFIYCG